MELSKEKLFEKLQNTLTTEINNYPDDDFLNDCINSLEKKTAQSYGKKTDLIDALSAVEQHVNDLKVKDEFDTYFEESDSEDDEDEETNGYI